MSIFSKIPMLRPKRSVFDLSNDHKFSTNFGNLVPTQMIPIVPGDTFSIDSQVFVRLAPMVAPVMHNIDVFVHHFFVPLRILCDKKYYENLMSGGKDGKANNLNPMCPLYEAAQLYGTHATGSPSAAQVLYNSNYGWLKSGSLGDFLGIKFGWHSSSEEESSVFGNLSPDTMVYQDLKINMFPFLAYRKIYDDYYRDENFEDEWEYYDEVSDTWFGKTSNVVYYATLFDLRHRYYKKDYFTGALPSSQRGEDVSIGLSGSAPIVSDGSNVNVYSRQNTGTQDNFIFFSSTDVLDDGKGSMMTADIANTRLKAKGLEFGNIVPDTSNSTNSRLNIELKETETGAIIKTIPVYITTNGANGVSFPTNFIKSGNIANVLQADLSSASAITINDLRTAFKLQRWQETEMRAGYRYNEQIYGHFGEYTDDRSLQRAEYLGGGKFPVQISDVLQTSQGTTDSAQGNMSGRGIAAGQAAFNKKKFTEHGYVFSIFSILPRNDYMTGITKEFLKQDRFDYYWPEFAHLGEQEVKTLEIYPESGVDEVFGYVPRYSEYKFIPNKVSGEFTTPYLDEWHLARKFENAPKLGVEFGQCNSDIQDWLNRIFAVTSNELVDHFYVYTYNKIKAVRPMPYHVIPSL